MTTAPQKRYALVLTLLVLWGASAVGGLAMVWKYSLTPGAEGRSPVTWPAEVSLPREADQATLVMLVHPKCSCSHASVAELAKVMTRLSGKAHAFVLFSKPSGTADDWEKTELWRRVAELPGVTPLVDSDSQLAGRFGARTSGHTVLYGPGGELRYSGGITGARGHEGDNLGESSLLAAATEGRSEATTERVFGCALKDSPHEELDGRSRSQHSP
jgi:hypothetical protein